MAGVAGGQGRGARLEGLGDGDDLDVVALLPHRLDVAAPEVDHAGAAVDRAEDERQEVVLAAGHVCRRDETHKHDEHVAHVLVVEPHEELPGFHAVLHASRCMPRRAPCTATAQEVAAAQRPLHQR